MSKQYGIQVQGDGPFGSSGQTVAIYEDGILIAYTHSDNAPRIITALQESIDIGSVDELHAYPSKSGRRAVAERLGEADLPHEYESPRGMAGPILECAVCGELRSAPIHNHG